MQTSFPPLPVRERIKVRVLIQRASFARDSRFCPSSLFLRTAEGLIDCVEYFVHVCKHLMVPKSKDSIIPRLQKRSANLIFLRKFGVLRAIEFNNEPSFDRAEIGEVRANRMLTPELGALDSAASQMTPQHSFSVGLFPAQPPRVPLR
jgi:hypothetical protein